MHCDSISGMCLDLQRIWKRFPKFIALLMEDLVCLVQRKPLSKYKPECLIFLSQVLLSQQEIIAF